MSIMVIVNLVMPFFFLKESIAIVTIVAVIFGGAIGEAITRTHGFTKLLSVMHGPWIPVFVLQLLVLIKDNPQGNFKTWLLASTVITGTSLIIDVIDLIKYIKGDRKDLLE